jgi:cholesterol transport system auxiliary component
MKAMNNSSVTHSYRLFAAGLSLLAVCACGTLRPAATPNSAFYSLEGMRSSAPAATAAEAPTLIINPPHAAAGFDSPRIIYVRETHKLEYFAHSEWIDPPARMLAPLLVAAVESTGAFRAVVLTPSSAAGDLRLDTEIIRLQHEFLTQPSRVRFTLRAYLVDDKTRRVLAWREFDAVVPAASEDPYGGVVAANGAVQTLLENLAAFCAEAARSARTVK